MQVLDHVLGLVAQPHERNADHGPGATAPAHAVNGDTRAAVELGDYGVGCLPDELAFTFGIGRRIAAHEILQADRRERARRRVVGRNLVGQAYDVADAFGKTTNKVLVLGKDGARRELAGPKQTVAHAIWDMVRERLSR